MENAILLGQAMTVTLAGKQGAGTERVFCPM